MNKIGRNDPCPCGSGKKYKQCCSRREVAAAAGKRSGGKSLVLQIPQAIQIALRHHQAGRLAQAEALYRQVLQAEPNHPDALYLLGLIAHQAGRNETAVELINKAITASPLNAAYHSGVGAAYAALKRFDEAIASCRKALSINPDYAEAHNNLGIALEERGETDQATTSYRRALSLKPDYAEAHYNLGNALRAQDKINEAIDCFRKALLVNPSLAGAYNSLGIVFRDQGRCDEAMACCRKALSLKPAYAEAHYNLGNVLRDQGRRDEATACYQKALLLKPDLAIAHHALIYTMNQSTEDDGAAVFAQCKKFSEEFEKSVVQLPHRNDPDPDRRIKLGYVSGDFRHHSVAYFIEPVLANHDHRAVEVFCYSNHRQIDAVTKRLMGYADHWCSVVHVPDDKVAALIQQDGIDILVDLSGHTNHNRLLVFARKPAPVQVTWVGLHCTTGLSAMDYRLTNHYSDPVGMTENHHAETLVRLSCSNCYRPEVELPAVNELPALASGHVTFSSFNNPQKISLAAFALWSRILAMLPGSRLMMVCQASFRDYAGRQFMAGGVESERIDFVDFLPVRDYLALHHKVDIALDPFPYNGGTITRNSLWMGVPVVTLAGGIPVSRNGLALLSQVGLEAFIAKNEEEYMQIALRWARNLEGLAQIRSALRRRTQEAPFSNAEACTREVEAAYRHMWRTWCAEQPVSTGYHG